MNPEDKLPLGVRLSLAFLRFLWLALLMSLVGALIGGGTAAWLTAIEGESLQDGIFATLVGLAGVLIANVLYGGCLFIEALTE